jgi:hypothetical protein
MPPRGVASVILTALGGMLALTLAAQPGAVKPLPCLPFPPEDEAVIPACADTLVDGQTRVRREALEKLSFNADGLAPALIDGVLVFVSRHGKTAPAFPFDNGVDCFVEGFARTLKAGKIGFVDKDLDEAVPAIWDFAYPFDQGVAVVCDGCRAVPAGEHFSMEGGRWGYIDVRGRIVVPVEQTRTQLPPLSEALRRLRDHE